MKERAALLAGILALLVLGNALYVVNEYEQVILTQFGKPVDAPVSTPGLKLRLPFIQKVHRFEKRFLEWDGDANQLPTKDKRFIWVDTYARWRITDPLLYFQRLRDERGAQTRLDDILDGETRNAIANHDLVELIRTSNRTPSRDEFEVEETSLDSIRVGREAIRSEVLAKSQLRTADLGIEILDVQFKRINYVQEVQAKVNERMISERRRIADRFRSEGEGEASRIRGEKERDLKRVQSEAYRRAQEIVGEADAEASRIYAEAFNRSADSRSFYEFLKSMEMYQGAFDSTTTLVLSTDGDFYKFLSDAAGK